MNLNLTGLLLIVIKNQKMNNTQNDFISGIGNTPLIKLRAASEITGCNIYGKAEFLKDRKSTRLNSSHSSVSRMPSSA